MIKLLVFSLLGKQVVSSRVLFNSIKSYLIVYMMVLPAILGATSISDQKEDFSIAVVNVNLTPGIMESDWMCSAQPENFMASTCILPLQKD